MVTSVRKATLVGTLNNAMIHVFPTLCRLLLCTLLIWVSRGAALADSHPALLQQAQIDRLSASEYHTPLAGEPCTPEVFGERINILGRDRDNSAALVLGGTMFTPPLAGLEALPIGAVYLKHRWDDTRFRGVFSIFVNEADVSKSVGSLQFLGHLDNNTIPFPTAEIAGGREVKRTSIIWGNVTGRLGVGLRLPVAPFQVDNDLRVQLFYQGGYLYSKRVSDTGPNVVLPPDTLVHGPLLRLRYDGLARNLLELPHRGVAAGVDAEFMRRDSWSDANYGGAVYTRDETRDYFKVSGYLTAAAGIPGLSEKNRLLMSFYGGFAPYGSLDRFSAFRIGGGPLPSETDDLYRQVYPGAMFNQFPSSDYLIGSAEYRRELLFFLYLHLRATYAWVNRDIFTSRRLKFLDQRGEAYSAAITSGFLWDSELYLEYAYDTSILRNGSSGNTISVLWSKGF
ncbi:hypothetical protein JN12_00682 [Geobacter argillaceus]|uniref:Porin n=2 Tax=Geobacter argillaceus TaxID=345631 RepID=A0A562WSH2_9BACT|nr:hypothetical protein JN12_00682 [Geobacter argillaceus]